MNKQQLFFIQSLLNKRLGNNGQPIMVNVKEKHEGIPYKIELNLNTNGEFILYRVHTPKDVGLWNSWEDKKEVERWFKTASLI